MKPISPKAAAAFVSSNHNLVSVCFPQKKFFFLVHFLTVNSDSLFESINFGGCSLKKRGKVHESRSNYVALYIQFVYPIPRGILNLKWKIISFPAVALKMTNIYFLSGDRVEVEFMIGSDTIALVITLD